VWLWANHLDEFLKVEVSAVVFIVLLVKAAHDVEWYVVDVLVILDGRVELSE
jgi:hypothetical protein